MAEAYDGVSRALGRIAREPGLIEDAPPALLELVELVSDEDAEDEVLENAAELLSPSDRREVREFCAHLRDSPGGDDPALAEGMELMDALLARVDERET